MSNNSELSTHIRPIPRHILEEQAYYQSLALEQPAGSERGLKDYLQLLIKYRWLIATVAAVVFVLTALYSFLATPMYTATATLKISTYAPLIPGASVEDVMMQQSRETDYLNTQVEILSGLTLADRVMSDGSLGPTLKSYFESQGGFLSFLKPLKKMFSNAPEQGDSRLDAAYNFPISTLEGYQSLVKISPVRRTSLVEVSATTANPELSAKIANKHSAAFIELIRSERQKTTLDNLIFLKSQAQELAEKVALTERNIATYAEENAIVSLNKDENIVVKQMSELNALLTAATAARIKSESAFQEARSGSGLDSTAYDDQSIQQQRVALKEAQAEYALLSEKFKPGFPKMVQLQARIDALKANLKQQRNEVIRGLEAKYKSDLEAEKALSEQLEIQKSKAFELSRREVQYNIMKREYESLKDLHQTVLRQLKEAQLSAESSGTNIAISDNAAVPLTHSSPKRLLNMLLALIVGPLLGCGLALTLESLDNTIKTPEEAERLLNVPSLGVVPMFALEAGEKDLRLVTAAERNAADPEEMERAESEGASAGELIAAASGGAPSLRSQIELVTVKSPRSIASESFRTVRTSILLSSADNPPRVVLVTSGQKSEGKTTLVTNLAVTLAQSGHRTLLIDADLRRPALHRQFGGDGLETGLVDYLTGQAPLEAAVGDSPVPNLDVLLAGTIPPNPSELLGSKKMAELLTELKEQYDYIFVDAPPVLPVTDAVVLSRAVDGVVIVVRGQETQQQVAQNAINRLKQVGANILGTVLNDVDLRSGDYYYYRRGYYAYYRDDKLGAAGKRRSA